MPVSSGFFMGGELSADLASAGGTAPAILASNSDDWPAHVYYRLFGVDGQPLTDAFEAPFVNAECWDWWRGPDSFFVSGADMYFLVSGWAWQMARGDLWRLDSLTGVPEHVNIDNPAFIRDPGFDTTACWSMGGVQCYDIAPDGTVWYVIGLENANLDTDGVDYPMKVFQYDPATHVSTLKYTDPGFTINNGDGAPQDPRDLCNGNNAAGSAHKMTISADGQKIVILMCGPALTGAASNFTAAATNLDGNPSLVRSLDGGAIWEQVYNWMSPSNEAGTQPFGGESTGVSGWRDFIRYHGNRLVKSICSVIFDGHVSGWGRNNSIWYSDDDGDTWTKATGVPDGATFTNAPYWLARSQPSWGDRGVVVWRYGTNVKVFGTSDGGATWSQIGGDLTGYYGLVDAGDAADYDPVTDTVTFWWPSDNSALKYWRYPATISAAFSGSPAAAVKGADLTSTTFNIYEKGFMSFVGTGQPLAHIADRTAIEFGEAAIILAGTNIVNPVYYISDADPNNWKRCIGAPVRDDGTWICRDSDLGKFVFGFHDDKIYRGDVVAGVMTATLAPATLSGDKANHAIWIGELMGDSYAGCYIVAADGGIWQTWDRFETVEKIRPATGFPAWVGKGKMIAMSKPV